MRLDKSGESLSYAGKLIILHYRQHTMFEPPFPSGKNESIIRTIDLQYVI
jgi:hypothetical protein